MIVVYVLGIVLIGLIVMKLFAFRNGRHNKGKRYMSGDYEIHPRALKKRDIESGKLIIL